MSRLVFNHTSSIETAMSVVFDRPRGQKVLAGGARSASPALVRSRI